MNVTLFSENRILYRGDDKTAVTGIYIPMRSKTKRYADITQPSDQAVKVRYGDADDTAALWRADGPYVDVYGNIPLSLQERRSAVSVYLPQDFTPTGCTSFYYVFGDRWIAHGVLHVSDDGQESWGVSLLDGDNGGVVDTIVSSISERILDGAADDISVAVHDNQKVLGDLTEVLHEFGVAVKSFKALSPSRKVKPLYMHRDFSILMVTMALCVFIALAGTISLWVVGQIDLGKQKTEIAKTREEILKIQSGKHLGHVGNPHMILDYMQSPLPFPPSALVQGAAQVGTLFGELKRISVGEPATVSLQSGRDKSISVYGTYPLHLEVETSGEALLHDQERIGRAAFRGRPWLRSIERIESKENNLSLKLEVQVK